VEPFWHIWNANHNIPMTNLRILPELMNYSNCTRDLKSWNSEINEFPTSFLCLSGFKKVSPWSTISFWFGFVGQSLCLQFSSPVSSGISTTYFFVKLQLLPLTEPFQYQEPRSLKWLNNYSFSWEIWVASFCVIT